MRQRVMPNGREPDAGGMVMAHRDQEGHALQADRVVRLVCGRGNQQAAYEARARGGMNADLTLIAI